MRAPRNQHVIGAARQNTLRPRPFAHLLGRTATLVLSAALLTTLSTGCSKDQSSSSPPSLPTPPSAGGIPMPAGLPSPPLPGGGLPTPPSSPGLPPSGTGDAAGPDAFEKTLEEMDEEMRRNRETVQNRQNDKAGGGSEEVAPPIGGGAGGSGGGAAPESPGGGGGGAAPEPTGGGGPIASAGSIPEDLADGDGDDSVARQLREAAMRETNPQLRDKLWEEYRRYKAGAS